MNFKFLILFPLSQWESIFNTLPAIHQALLQSLPSYQHPEERAEVPFFKKSTAWNQRRGGSCAWCALGELRQHLLPQGLAVPGPELAVHTQLQTASSECKCKVLGALRDINQQQNHSSLAHLFLQSLLSSSMNQKLVLSTPCYNSTKHRQQVVTSNIPPTLVQMTYLAHFKSLPVQIIQDYFFSKIQVQETSNCFITMWFPSMGSQVYQRPR